MSIPLETPQDGAEKPGVVLQLFRKQPGDENLLELLQDSADFPVLAKLRLDIDVKIQNLYGCRDALNSAIREQLRKFGRQSVTIGGYEAHLKPATVLRCECHRVAPERCQSVQAGQPVTFVSVSVDRRLTLSKLPHYE
jgi:hypothetical protein